MGLRIPETRQSAKHIGGQKARPHTKPLPKMIPTCSQLTHTTIKASSPLSGRLVSKAMRVFNKRTKIVKEALNIRFLENTTNVKRNGPDWPFDVDSLTISINSWCQSATVSEEDAEEKPIEMEENGALGKDRKDDQATRMKPQARPSQQKVPEPSRLSSPSSRGSTSPLSTSTSYRPLKFDFATVKTASTPIEPNKALIKDEEAIDVDDSFYKIQYCIILIYLPASLKKPDITFVVCACARFQVTPKTSHLHAVKRIFRYLKGQPKLGLWYPRDSPFDLEAFSDSDYAGASLDRKSTIGGCQFLSKRLISWQCKKQTIDANSTTEAEYVAAANCCGQVLWIQNQMLDYGFNFMNTKIFIDNESTICIMKNPVFHSKTKHIEIRHHFIRDCYEKKLIQVIKIHIDHNVADLLIKAFDVSSGPINLVVYETVYKEWEDRMERAATTTSSLDVEQDSDAQTRFETTSKQSNAPPLSRGYTLGCGEDNMKLLELMELCIKLSDLVSKKKREML
ncbi:hypothetical protein Tco_0871497 [Tanacetum coccineum]